MGDVVTQGTTDCFIMGQDRLIATNRVKNLVIVDTQDSVFVSDIENSRDVKDIVAKLKKDGRKEFYQHLTVYHEWGKSTLLHQDEGAAVFHLTLFPGPPLHLDDSPVAATQVTVTQGRVRISDPKGEQILTSGQSIPLTPGKGGLVENAGDVPACLIAVELKGD